MQMTHTSGTLGAAVADRAVADRVVADKAVVDRAIAAMAVNGGSSLRLTDLATGAVARVISVTAVDSSGSVELSRRLAELGFLPGEKLRIVARGLMGREPLAVRIGTGTFALRLFEAACIRVSPEPSLKV